MDATERHDAVVDLDFDRLCVEESNLQLAGHRGDCSTQRQSAALLAADDGGQGQGRIYLHARLLAEYLRHHKGLTCDFHYGPNTPSAWMPTPQTQVRRMIT